MTDDADRRFAASGPVLHKAIAIVPKNLAAGEAIERGRRPPHSTVKAMKNARIGGVAMPREWGGPELDRLTRFPETCSGKVGLADEKPSWVEVLSVMAGTVVVLVGCYALNLLTRMLLS